ncbi:uncharacterized protein LOC119370570 [Jatropha curcas]|uniref:uncharacterized protein LOC119370570 n=1 Tax=Jatropha curcas TaxID=180498 RepID=UPI001895A490|nr:uncharacterized protein LOC119370570 [Jatropha curcas]
MLRATYQKNLATTLSSLMMIHKGLEVYSDDMVIALDKNTTKTQEEHTKMLEKFFARVKQYNLRLNPKKCVFGVMKGKLLGFIVGPNGIEVNPNKIKAIQDMEPPKTERQLLRKNQPVRWNEDCQKAFDHIKKYLMNSLVLNSPRLGEPLILYLSIEDAGVGAMLVFIFLLSKIDPYGSHLHDRHATLERTLSKWLTLRCLSVDCGVRQRKTATVSEASRLSARVPGPEPHPIARCMNHGKPGGIIQSNTCHARSKQGSGKLLPFNAITPIKMELELVLLIDRSTPMAELTTMCKRLLATVEEDRLERWKVEEDRLKPYVEYLLKKAVLFDKITFTHIGRTHNRIPDALANLASAWQDLSKVELEEEHWFTDILRYMKDGTFSNDATKEDRSVLRKMALNYVLADGELYRRAWDGMLYHRRALAMDMLSRDLLKGQEQGRRKNDNCKQDLMRRVCRVLHLSGMSLARKIMSEGYFLGARWTR